MKIGWIGLGKLGLPCALALAHYGSVEHDVLGYDTNPDVATIIKTKTAPTNHELGLAELLAAPHGLSIGYSVADTVAHTDEFVFVAVPTPHDPEYGGEQVMPTETRDFNYDALVQVATDVAKAAIKQRKNITLVVISTSLPGTMRERVLPVLNQYVSLVYNPFFIAMGTTIGDFCYPEFVLVGADGDTTKIERLYEEFYRHHAAPRVLTMSYEEAELVKVSYNTFISMKIVFANTVGEIADKVGANADVVTSALSRANRRLTSPMYLTAGVGDGGACHPRDNIAMSWLAKKLNLSVDPFEFVTRARESQTYRIANIVKNLSGEHGLPIVILGKAYKPESNLTYGSPALLLQSILTEWDSCGECVVSWDPYVDDENNRPMHDAIYVIMTKHAVFAEYIFTPGSYVVDPHRYVGNPASDRVRWIGRG